MWSDARYSAPALTGTSNAAQHYEAKSVRITLAVLLVTLIVLGVISWRWVMEPASIDARRQQIWQHAQDANYAAAEQEIVWLLRDFPDSHQDKWSLAKVHEALGKAAEADEIRLELAVAGYGPAALSLLQRQFPLDGAESWSDDQHEQFEQLAAHAARSPTLEERIEANKLLASYFVTQGRIDSALSVLDQLAAVHSPAYIHAASLSLRQGDRQRAMTYAAQAHKVLAASVTDKPHDDAARLNLARSLLLLGRESDALKALADGYDLTRQPLLQQAGGEVLVGWARRLETEEGAQPTFWKRFQLIQRATACAPQDALVLAALLDLLRECQRESDKRLDELRIVAASGQEMEGAHMLLGLLSLSSAQEDIAALHFKSAASHWPLTASLLNNLALAMLSRSDFTADQALQVIDAALRLVPAEPQFSKTRQLIRERLDP